MLLLRACALVSIVPLLAAVIATMIIIVAGRWGALGLGAVY
jgi:hypothetical protein